MTEIKAPFHKRVAFFLSEHLTLIAILVLLGVVLFSSCVKAKATSMDAYYKEWLIDYIQKYSDDVSVPYEFIEHIQGYCNTYDSFIAFKTQSSYGIMVYMFNSSNPFFCPTTSGEGGAPNWSVVMNGNKVSSGRNFGFFDGRGLVYNQSTLSGTVGINGDWTGRIVQTWGSNNGIRDTVVSPGTNRYQQGWSPYFTYTSAVQGSGYYTLFMAQGTTIYTNYDEAFLVANYSSNGNYFYKLEQNVVAPSSVEDSRLQFSKWTNALGKDMLHVELTDFVSDYLNLTTNVEVPQFDFTVEYTEAISGDTIELTYNFDDSSEYFDAYYENAKLKRVYFNIPFSELVGYDLQSNSFPDYSDVRITSAVLDLDYVVIGAGITGNVSESILTNFYLQHVYSEVVPDVIPDPSDIYEDVITQIEIDGSKLIVEDGGSDYTAGNFQFVSEYPTFFSWTVVNTKNVFYVDDATDTLYAYPSTITFKYYDSDYVFDVAQYIYDNAESMYFDVIVISVRQAHWNTGNVLPNDPPDSEQLKGYYVFYTNRFYARLDAINQLNIIDVIQKEANQDKENWEWLVTKLNDFEAKTLKAITGEENSLFTYINDLDNDLNSGISRIIESLPDFEPFDESVIIDSIDSLIATINGSEPSVFSKLDSIIGLLRQSNVNSDWYVNYKEWLYTRNEDAIVDPHEFFVSELDDVKKMFSSFFSTSVIAEFMSDMGTLLDYLSGDNGYLDMYVRTGIQDNGFDLTTYTVYSPSTAPTP